MVNNSSNIENKNSKATLVILAAGIGSRFGGGIKQLEPVGPGGEIIMDYSIYDAIEAGFNKVVFVIRKDLEEDFRDIIGNRISKIIEVDYAYQEIDSIPTKYQELHEGRKKPWGTGQAILVCKDIVNEPFLVINADDYYGRSAYKSAYEYLTKKKTKDSVMDKEVLEIAMVSFVLRNTLSEFGAVTRGICQVDENDYLTSIVETSNIEKLGKNAIVRMDDGDELIDIDSAVSMNMWCLFPEIFPMLEEGFNEFLSNLKAEGLEEGYLKGEYLLPTVMGDLLKDGQLTIKVLESKDKWFGVTYKEDKEAVIKGISKLINKGFY